MEDRGKGEFYVFINGKHCGWAYRWSIRDQWVFESDTERNVECDYVVSADSTVGLRTEIGNAFASGAISS